MPEDVHPATPEQTEHGFDEGLGRRPRSPAERRVGSFGDGLVEESPDERPRRRFSEGVEREAADGEKGVERRFSEGLEGGDPGADDPRAT